ncbi:MAG: rhomboid family intramembrane serine protease [Tannerella sp.]|jgi:membrane associated rhomboid family serine protease|nr:rhomboid family intramembrane serine protease [Tannerella sp.]
MEQRGFNSYGNIPPVTKNLLIINTILWLATWLMQDRVDLVNLLGLHFPGAKDFYIFQFFTYMFMHGGFTHLFFNMFAVYMFGRIIESTWGSRRFLFYYIVTGLGAAVIQELVWLYTVHNVAAANGLSIAQQIAGDPSSNFLITIGASGSVFGILLAFAMYFPNIQMFIIPFPFPIKAKYLVIGYGAIELFTGIANFSGDNIAHFAHLGGMLFGLILILYWKKKDKAHGRHFY